MIVKPELFCQGLETKACTEYKILVTGATGYIGGVLIPELLARGYQVCAMVRNNSPEYKERWPDVEIIEADVLNYKQLKKALKGIDCAYYFIHSFHSSRKYKDLDLKAAQNFSKACEENDLKRIIYLSSLGDTNTKLSDHLSSRHQVANILQQSTTPLTVLRAAVILGSGSASHKIIYQLSKTCPVFIFPVWSNSLCQPIAISDVIKYLVGSLENEKTSGEIFDIGGQDVLSYKMMIKTHTKFLDKKCWFFNSSFSGISVYAKIVSLFTTVSSDLIKVLLKSCVNDVVCQNDNIKKLLPFQVLSYEESLERTLKEKSGKSPKENIDNSSDKPGRKKELSKIYHPPNKSRGIFSDVWNFLLKKPGIPTLLKFKTVTEREDFSYRIYQRLSVEADQYRILNGHQIGINAPTKYVFEELLNWNGDSTCWPNYIAKVEKEDNKLEKIFIYLFGWSKFSSWLKNTWFGRNLFLLFHMDMINIEKLPNKMGSDNARYLLYNCGGGYPIGFFSMYVRSSIAKQKEKEQSQLFLIVGFNFYGRKEWSNIKLINRVWEMLHDRVTAHVLNRIKQLSEWRFDKIKNEYYGPNPNQD